MHGNLFLGPWRHGNNIIAWRGRFYRLSWRVPSWTVASWEIYFTEHITSLFIFVSFLFSIHRQLRGTRSGKILIHLCASLFCLNLVFFIDSIPSVTSSYPVCIGCAILLHYFVLTSFSWMGMEAVNMYRALVQVFIRGSTGNFMTKCILISWGNCQLVHVF